MAEAKDFKVVAADSVKKGTKHRVQLEIQKRTPERYVEIVDGKPVNKWRGVFKTLYIKNVVLDNVLAATIQTAARALMAEFKALPRDKASSGFASYEEEFNRA